MLLSGTIEAQTKSPRPPELLRAAKETAAWLDSMAIVDPTGAIRWPVSLEQQNIYATGLDRGAAGIGTFYLRFWEVTAEAAYLQRANGAALFIAERFRAGQFNGPDWLAGAASGGVFALKLYRHTGDRNHLKLAKTAANYLLRSAHTDQAGYYWDHFPGTTNIYVGIPHGAAGIGFFFVDLYQETKDLRFLQAAEQAYTWADQYSVELASGAKGYKRLTTDAEVYVLWSGSTGMITFQNALWKATGNPKYLNELERTAQSLLEHSIPQRKGIAWPYHPGTRSFPTPYFHGAASTIEALLIAYEATGRDDFRTGAMKGAQWLISIKKSEGKQAYYWPHFFGSPQYDTGLGVGTASVGTAFVRLQQTVRKRIYLEHALGAARYLLKISERPAPGQRSWINYTNPEDADYAPKEHSTGWADGAAGIGIFLLDLYDEITR